MIVTLTYVASLNGKITKGDDVHVSKWTSKEDQKYFKSVLNEHKVIIRTSKTYEAAKKSIKDNPNKRVIVLTRDPAKYQERETPENVEFTSEPLAELVERLKSEKIDKVLLAVGGATSTQFFKEKLIDYFYITYEPKLFGSGVDYIAESELDVSLKLESIERLNKEGSILLKYKVVK